MNARLMIEMDPQGIVTVKGPINQKFLCYGMLESARDAIKDFNDKAAQQPQIAIASPGDVPDISKDRRLSFNTPLGGRT